MKTIILCADDFGQNAQISAGILQLVAIKRLSAVSCMTTSKFWSEQALLLKAVEADIDVGLHFNLTHGDALTNHQFSLQDLPQLLKNAYLKKLNSQKITAELNAQIDNFILHFERYPDFIDGHQHVHQFPLIREILMTVYQQRFHTKKIYLRVTSTNFWRSLADMSDFPKSQIIHFSGGLALRKLCLQGKIPFNKHFSGIYNFKNALNYRTYFQNFLKKAINGSLIMCHPGLASDDQTDVLHQLRQYEFNYFMSDQFLKDCENNKVRVAKFKI